MNRPPFYYFFLLFHLLFLSIFLLFHFYFTIVSVYHCLFQVAAKIPAPDIRMVDIRRISEWNFGFSVVIGINW